MSETLKVGDIFPVRTSEELKTDRLTYWEQRIATPLGIFLYDSENEYGDGHSRWISEDGKIRITTHNTDNKITHVSSL